MVGINGASAALHVSDIPFLGPIGAVRVGLVNGQFIVNPTYNEMRESLVNIMVVGTSEGIVMIESGAKEVKEETVVDAIEFGHTEIKKICKAINELRDKSGKPKRKVEPPQFYDAYYNDLKKNIGADLADALDTKKHPKATSHTLVKEIKKKLAAALPKDDEDAKKKLDHYYEVLRERIFRDQVTHQKRRPDGRAFDEIREIWIEAGVLPRTHGSAISTERVDILGDEIEDLVEPLLERERRARKRLDKGRANAVALGVPFVLLRDGTADAVETCVKRTVTIERAYETAKYRGNSHGVVKTRATIGNPQFDGRMIQRRA